MRSTRTGRRRPRPRLVAMVLSATLVLAACGGAEDTDTDTDTDVDAAEDEDADTEGTNDATPAADGGEIEIAIIEDADTLDPTFGQTLGGRYIFANMCEKLYDATPQLELVPQLAAELPEFSDDALTATIQLREGVVFNDGEPFNAEAVKISLDRHREAEGSARAGELTPIESVTAVDELTVELALSEPYAPLTAILADRSGMIMSPAALDELGVDFGQDPVCVGPFEFAERVVGDSIVLDRAPDYYDADQVFLDRVTFRPISDAAVQTANLRSGSLQMVDRLPTQDVDAIGSEDGIEVDEITSIGHDSIMINVQDGPFADPLVREAFELAIDRQQIVDTAFDGLATPSCQPFPPASPFVIDGFECVDRDVEAAQALLAEAGVTTPVEVDFLSLNNTLDVRRGEVIQSQAAEAGFNVALRATEAGTLIDDAASGNFDMVVLNWSGRFDPDGNVFVFQHTDGGQNFGLASDATIDGLLEDARAEVDESARQDLYREAWEAATERGHQLILLHRNLYIGRSQDVSGFEAVGDGLIRLKGVSLAN